MLWIESYAKHELDYGRLSTDSKRYSSGVIRTPKVLIKLLDYDSACDRRKSDINSSDTAVFAKMWGDSRLTKVR